MERFFNNLFRYIPEWAFVLLILVVGLSYFMYETPLYQVCDAQINEYAKGQRKKLFGRRLPVSKKRCTSSLRGMGCLEYFEIYDSVLADFDKLDDKCLVEMSQKQGFVKTSLGEFMTLLTQMAWGENPPETKVQKRAWLSDKELQNFCNARKYFRRFYTSGDWDALVRKALSPLIESPNQQKKKTLVEEKLEEMDEEEEKAVYFFPKSKLTLEKAYELSLLSFDCAYY